ncbi:hypothetical protein BJY52DRAFT_1183650 [Lactarius psammicola]|nr:hypothetical protein BJY52DRAFT_1183650 [Lactarius psammicola]
MPRSRPQHLKTKDRVPARISLHLDPHCRILTVKLVVDLERAWMRISSFLAILASSPLCLVSVISLTCQAQLHLGLFPLCLRGLTLLLTPFHTNVNANATKPQDEPNVNTERTAAHLREPHNNP